MPLSCHYRISERYTWYSCLGVGQSKWRTDLNIDKNIGVRNRNSQRGRKLESRKHNCERFDEVHHDSECFYDSVVGEGLVNLE